MNQEKLQNILAEAGITINGSAPWDITVHNEKFYNRILTNIELALGETYVEGWWDCPQLDLFFFKVLKANLGKKLLSNPPFWLSALNIKLYQFFRRHFYHNSQRKSLVVGKRHYDLGNDFYQAMLGSSMVYTCAYWEKATSLEQAQEDKLHLVCKKLDLSPGMTLLDIGCGWGSLAKFAAEHYQVSVVGITISRNQAELGQQMFAGLPIEIRYQDYRELLKSNIQFDRVVSLGMFEHVGISNYPQYMQIVSHCLKQNGLFLLHTIGTNSSQTTSNIWLDAYIFPDGQLPTISSIANAFEGIFIMEDWQNFGVYYDKTLMTWYHNFNHHWDSLKKRYDEPFRRMWNYYLLACAAAFRARQTQLWQIVLSKEGLPEGFKNESRIL